MLTYAVNNTIELSWKGLWNTILETVNKWLVIIKQLQQTIRGNPSSSCFIYLTIWPYPRFLWKISPPPSLGLCHHILDSILHCLPVTKIRVMIKFIPVNTGCRREGDRERERHRVKEAGRASGREGGGKVGWSVVAFPVWVASLPQVIPNILPGFHTNFPVPFYGLGWKKQCVSKVSLSRRQHNDLPGFKSSLPYPKSYWVTIS